MTNKNLNMQIWELVESTDPSATKKATFDGREQTSIKGTYMVMQATKLFGPIGIRWGYNILEERFDQGGPIMDANGAHVCNMVMHTLKVQLWYIRDKTRAEIVHYGHTPYVTKTSYGIKTDMDAPKKSLTDAIKKCLSMLGFSADVYMGKFDDDSYVGEQKLRETIAQADNVVDEMTKQRQDFHHMISEMKRGYPMAPSVSALNAMHRANVTKAKPRAAIIQINPDQVEQSLNECKQARLAELTPKVPTVCRACGNYTAQGVVGAACSECGNKTAPAEEATGADTTQVNGD